jgi:hypothetical protein
LGERGVSQLDCCFHQQLGIGAGDESMGRNLEVDAEELLVAGDVSCRFVIEATVN